MSDAPPRIWTAPIVIGFLSLVCLIIALLDDGMWDLGASLVLAAVLAFASWKGIVTRG